jgi:hypothetical protein
MASGVRGSSTPRYDRDFLLSPAKRNQIIELWEVEKFGHDSFGDPDAVSLYGMRHMDRAALARLLDPANYLGLCGEMIDHVIARGEQLHR